MNEKEIGEIRRRMRRDRSNMPAIYGCYVNDKKEIVSEFRQSTGIMSENEADRYFGLMKRTLSGALGKNLIDISFTTAQVANSAEHKALMELRSTELKDDEKRKAFFQTIIDSVSLDEGYLILMGCESYDVPFKSKDEVTQSDAGEEIFTYLSCAICPVKQSKASLQYDAQDRAFHDGGISQVAAVPALGFLFPAFDNRSANIYNALFYTRDSAKAHQSFIETVFHTEVPMPAAEQKRSFETLLTSSLGETCSLEVVQQVHDDLRQCIALHKESKVREPLLVNKEQIRNTLSQCNVPEKNIAKFAVDFDEAFGFDAQLYPKNIIDNNKFEIRIPDISIKVAPDKSDLIETRVIGGVKYILICADENVEVNGVNICISEED